MQSKAKTVAQYLKELPADRRATISALRDVVLRNMDGKLEEGMQYGMIGWYIPHRVFPAGYHCDPKQPLPFACLASQKNYVSLYLMQVYADGTPDEQWFRKAWAKSGKKLNMGKCCLRFQTLDDLALDVIAEAFRRAKVDDYLETYAKVDPRNKSKAAKTPAAKKSATKRGNTPAARPRRAAAKKTARAKSTTRSR
ncbi:MAG: DUF1801 domain-containing protein [Gemmatimonadaceae bacterium]|nr:DUF1801 domain-containing protein [Gemmatimonadaceae bacterium]